MIDLDYPKDISVVVPLHNREGLIPETLNSLLGQTLASFEILVVDDGSQDGGPALVADLCKRHSRLRLLCRPEDLSEGAPTCRNLGLQHSVGKYVIFLDSDDLLAVDAIGKRVDYLERNPEVDMVVSQGLIFHSHPGDSSTLWNRCDYSTCNLIERFLNQDIPWQTTGATWRREALGRIGGWNAKLACFQDWELHLRACILDLKIQVIPSPDFFVRRSDSISQISQQHNVAKHVESRIEAINGIISLLQSQNRLSGSVKRSAKGFILRNALSLADNDLHSLALQMLHSEAAKSLVGVLDRRLFSWLLKVGPTWHWNTRSKRVADLLWRGIQYDSATIQNDFMNTTYAGPVPTVSRSRTNHCD